MKKIITQLQEIAELYDSVYGLSSLQKREVEIVLRRLKFLDGYHDKQKRIWFYFCDKTTTRAKFWIQKLDK
jgi:hypothetical protein